MARAGEKETTGAGRQEVLHRSSSSTERKRAVEIQGREAVGEDARARSAISKAAPTAASPTAVRNTFAAGSRRARPANRPAQPPAGPRPPAGAPFPPGAGSRAASIIGSGRSANRAPRAQRR